MAAIYDKDKQVDVSIAKILIAAGVNIGAVDIDRRNAYFHAKASGQAELQALLRDKNLFETFRARMRAFLTKMFRQVGKWMKHSKNKEHELIWSATPGLLRFSDNHKNQSLAKGLLSEYLANQKQKPSKETQERELKDIDALSQVEVHHIEEDGRLFGKVHGTQTFGYVPRSEFMKA